MKRSRLQALEKILEYELVLMWNKDCYDEAVTCHAWIPYELSNVSIGDVPIVRFTLFLESGQSQESLECSNVFMKEVKDRIKEIMSVLDKPFVKTQK